MASTKARIIGMVRFNGLEDPFMLNHLIEECRIELRRQETGQFIEFTTPGKDSASHGFKFELAATTEEPCAIHFPREVRYGGAVAHLQAIDLIEFDNRWARRNIDSLDNKPLTLEAVEYHVLPGSIRVQLLDHDCKPVTNKPGAIQVLAVKGQISGKAFTSSGSWYDVSVPPGPCTLVVSESFSFQSGVRVLPLLVESSHVHVAIATSSPPAVTTGAIRFPIVDQDNNPIMNVPTASISLFQNGNQIVVSSSDNGLYGADNIPEGICTLSLPVTFAAPQVDATPHNSRAIIDQITNIIYKLQSPPMQLIRVQANETIIFPSHIYQRYGTLMWKVTIHGNPAPGLFVRVLNSDTGQSMGAAVSDAEGVAQIPLQLPAADPSELDVLVYRSGEPEGVAVAQRIPFRDSSGSPAPAAAPIPGAAPHTAPRKHAPSAQDPSNAARPAQTPTTTSQSTSFDSTHAAVHNTGA